MTKSRNLITPKFKWQPWQIAIIVCSYQCTPNDILCRITGANIRQVYNIAARYGLIKSKWFWNIHPCSGTTKVNSDRGNSGRFKKGHVTWNTGMKGLHTPGSEKGWFTAGHQPHNTHPVGSYRIEGGTNTLQKKISDAKGSNSKRWRGVHELVWIQANGPVPEKHICVFKPGTKSTVLEEITIDKVECISLAENCRRNSVHRHGPEIAKTYQLIGAINRQINRKEKKNGNSN